VQLEPIVTRLALAGLGVEARVRWRFGPTPAFDQRDAAGPFTTLVAFMPGSITEEIARLVQRLPGLGAHFRYPPAQIHMTVRNLDGVQLTDLPKILSQAAPIKLRSERLRFTPQTLLLQLAPTDRALRRLRTRLDALPGAEPPRWHAPHSHSRTCCGGGVKSCKTSAATRGSACSVREIASSRLSPTLRAAQTWCEARRCEKPQEPQGKSSRLRYRP
jgi:hypothetical protein